jgi:16S rRNA (cytosine1402-N4)-methyltransferase
MEKIPHVPVLLDEVLEVFAGLKSGQFVDCTLGYGGHSEAILSRFPDITLVGIDQDSEAIAFSTKRLAHFAERFSTLQGRYSERIREIDFTKTVGVLADIGVSSLQLDKQERGFSFAGDTLDMRMDQTREFSAYDVVNGYSQEELERIFWEYGEERGFKKIAKLIIQTRKTAPITTSAALATLIEKQINCPGIHPATRVFQAIRIEVNDELGELERFFDVLEKNPKEGMIVAVITFHSLEDRIVKNRFKAWSRRCICPPEAFRCECGNNNELGSPVTKKPLTASKQELKANPRSRSAKLRAFVFTKDKNGRES